MRTEEEYEAWYKYDSYGTPEEKKHKRNLKCKCWRLDCTWSGHAGELLCCGDKGDERMLYCPECKRTIGIRVEKHPPDNAMDWIYKSHVVHEEAMQAELKGG